MNFLILLAGVLIGLIIARVVSITRGLATLTVKGASFMRTFQATRPDEQIRVVPGTVVDGEGNVIDPQPPLLITVESTDTSVVSLEQDPSDQTLINIHYGAPGTAVIRARIQTADGSISEVIEETIRLTVGDPAGIAAGTFVFPDDAPVAVPEPPAPVEDQPAPVEDQPAPTEPLAPADEVTEEAVTDTGDEPHPSE
ncbi:MAG: hypothetical protein ABIP75_03205 [Pyrinomonadaceae bacterium]